MSIEPEPFAEPEIAHVLLMDVVGYSKLLVEDQILLLEKLKQIVRSTPQFIAAEAAGSLRRLPTGDGMALLFSQSPQDPPRCALQIREAARAHPEMKLRMGIHSGPVRSVLDVNDRPNVAGAGIDLAQRVLDCGDEGHILVSQRVAEDLKPNRHWHACLEDLGECEVKHGLRLRIFNLCKEGCGNPEVPKRIRQQRQLAGSQNFFSAATRPLLLLAGVSILVFAAWLGWMKWSAASASPNESVIPSKSIAVLPFANLSDDEKNAFFADGFQDEVLTNLRNLADLEVRSRTSVMGYRDVHARNLRTIAQELRVAFILEGSVQRDGHRVRITVQLIKASTDDHLWADHYDRDLSDAFAIQSEVAKTVAQQLGARISPREKAALEEPPTNDREAYALYVQGKEMAASTTFNARGGENLITGVRFLDQAIARDSDFFLAYYQLARAHNQIYRLGIDHTAARLAQAEKAMEALQRLKPEAGETSLARGEHYYWGYREYGKAREQFELARQRLPKDPRPVLLMAYLDRRQGRSEASLLEFGQALALEPRDLNILQQISLSYQLLRLFPEMASTLDRALAVAPDDVGTRIQRALVELEWRADLKPLQAEIASALARDPAVASNIANDWFALALCQRNSDEARRALDVMTASGCRTEGVLYPRAWCAGLAARTRGDLAAAKLAFEAARAEAEKTLETLPDYAEANSILAMIDAALGRKNEAINRGRRAVELLSLNKDAVEGAVLLENLALIYAWTGEKELALEQLAVAVNNPGPISYGKLRLHPNWDPLRGDPRFTQLMNRLAPKAEER